jgi:hypothetical protein
VPLPPLLMRQTPTQAEMLPIQESLRER